MAGAMGLSIRDENRLFETYGKNVWVMLMMMKGS
jgi:hypothetical protein